MNARNCKGLINNAVQEFLTNTALLYKQMAVATETDMLIPALSQKYMYFKQLAICLDSTTCRDKNIMDAQHPN